MYSQGAYAFFNASDQIFLNPVRYVFHACAIRGGSRRVAKFLQESILIAFDFIWKVLLSDRNFATLLDPPLVCRILFCFFFISNSFFSFTCAMYSCSFLQNSDVWLWTFVKKIQLLTL